jgi:hypothetical protein
MSDTTTPLDGLTTYTGESLVGALNALDSALPQGAYKTVAIGGRTFTDISPAYSLEVISEHFGPLGLGWGYTVEDEHTADHHTADKPQSDGSVKRGQHYLGVTLRLGLWYAAKRGTETVLVSWQSYGGNANAGSGADEHFSWQGALTNAIGKGWSMQGFQRRIYKGEDFTLDEKREAEAGAPPSAPAPSSALQTPAATNHTPGADFTLPFDKGAHLKGETLRGIASEGDWDYLVWFADNYGFLRDGTENPKFAAKNAEARQIAAGLVAHRGDAPAAPATEPEEAPDIPF